MRQIKQVNLIYAESYIFHLKKVITSFHINVHVLSKPKYRREIREVVFETVEALKEANFWSKMKIITHDPYALFKDQPFLMHQISFQRWAILWKLMLKSFHNNSDVVAQVF